MSDGKAAARRRPLSRRLHRWLRLEGSLSLKLDEAFGGFRVQPVFQGRSPATADEWRRLGLPGARRAHAREVVLWGNGQPLVFARSVLGAQHARRTWRAVLGLGSRTLGSLLFSGHAAAPRSGLQRLQVPCVGPEARRLRERWQQATGQPWPARTAWARCSVFRRRGLPLLITEIFAPAVMRRDPHAAAGRVAEDQHPQRTP